MIHKWWGVTQETSCIFGFSCKKQVLLRFSGYDAN